MGRRIRVTGGPWPERIGCEGEVVDDPTGARYYPFAGRGKDETVILLDDDPLVPPRQTPVPWSCAIRTSALEFLS